MLTSQESHHPSQRSRDLAPVAVATADQDDAEALWVVSDRAEICESNTRARDVMEDEDIAVDRFGRFHLRATHLDRQLQAMLSAGEAGTIAIGGEGGADRFRLRLFRLPSSGLNVLVLDRVESGHHRRLTGLRTSFALTPKETMVLDLLCQGQTLTDISERLAITLTTVRTHLRSLFAKTQVSRQAELVRLVYAN